MFDYCPCHYHCSSGCNEAVPVQQPRIERTNGREDGKEERKIGREVRNIEAGTQRDGDMNKLGYLEIYNSIIILHTRALTEPELKA